MIKLELNKARDIKPGDVIHLRVKSIEMTSRGRWTLTADDITPLPGAEPIGYACQLCDIIVEAEEDGSLPDGWVEKKFPERSFFVCKECNEGEHTPYCRVCGCTQNDACWDEEEGSCYWVEEDLCSACVGKGKKE